MAVNNPVSKMVVIPQERWDQLLAIETRYKSLEITQKEDIKEKCEGVSEKKTRKMNSREK